MFISNNTKEFSDPADKNKLHAELQIELDKLDNRTVLYYSSLEAFIKTHLSPIEHIEWQWIADDIDKIGLDNIMLKYINERRDKILPYFTRKYNKIVFDVDSELSLYTEGLRFVAQEDTAYTYRNGDVSIFAHFEGAIVLGTTYYPFFPPIDSAGLDFHQYSLDYVELRHLFNAQIELKIDNNKLVFSGVASFEMETDYSREMWYDNTTRLRGSRPAPIASDDDNDLPF